MPNPEEIKTDLLVVGGGNAALCAAMTAQEAGVKVLVLESAPKDFRGGNSRHTRNIRYVHNRGNDYLTGPYLEAEFWDDLLQVTGGQTHAQLARLTIRESADLGQWMNAHGCHFQPPLRGTLHLARTNAHFLGGGKALMNAYYATARKLGVEIMYEADVRDFEIRDGKFDAAIFEFQGACRKVRAKSVVVASGGFQANLTWLKECWGEAADNFIIRGSPYDKGRPLRVLLDHGAKPFGDSRQCHAVAMISSLCILILLLLLFLFQAPSVIFATHLGENAFYKVIPYWFIVIPFSALAIYIFINLLIGGINFWYETGGQLGELIDLRANSQAIKDVLQLKYLDGGGSWVQLSGRSVQHD